MVDFGTQSTTANILSAHLTGVTINCTNALPYTISLDNVLNVRNKSQRRMGKTGHGNGVGNSGPYITYNLYQDAAHQTLWTSVVTPSGTGNSTDTPVNIYATVPGQTTPQAGTYQDTVTMP